MPFLVENDEGIRAVLQPAFGKVDAVDGDFFRIPTEVVPVEKDAAAAQSRGRDTIDRTRAGCPGSLCLELGAEQGGKAEVARRRRLPVKAALVGRGDASVQFPAGSIGRRAQR